MRKLSFLLCTLFFCASVFSQVNMQTGSAEQSFPLINYSDSKSGLSLGIGLTYSSGNGLLVNEIASDIGTGWSLDAGGVIMRMQNGEPDDQQAYYSGQLSAGAGNDPGVNNTLQSYPNGYLYNTNVGLGCNTGLNYYPVYSSPTVYKERNSVAGDVEQDKFIFRVNGRMGVFVIGRDGTVTTLGDSRIKITFTSVDMGDEGIRTRINQFV